MTEADNTPNNEPEPKKDDAPKMVNMTQDEFNKIVSVRIDRAVHATEEKARKQAELDKLDGEARAKKEYEIKLDEIAKERDEAVKGLRMSNARAGLAERGLNADFAKWVIGDDDDATKANIDALSKMVDSQVAAKTEAGLHKGAPKAPTDGGAPNTNAAKEQIFKAFGVKAKQ